MRVDKFSEEIINIRHDLHRRPETAYKELLTQKYITDVLKRHGIEYDDKFFKTAVIAEIHGKKPGKMVALRADMDALDVWENPGDGPISEIEGKMHACGHDFHMTALLGAAIWLNENKDAFAGSVRLIFQPAEEGTDPKDNLIDSSVGLIEQGVLKDVDAIFGMHVWPEIEFGKVGVCNDKTMAAADFLMLK